MTDDRDSSADGDLSAFFDAARDQDAALSGGFMARLQADALRLQPVATLRHRRSRWSDLVRALGGWPVVAGLTAAACAGVWIGVSPPEAVLALLGDQGVIQAVDPLSGYDYAMLGG